MNIRFILFFILTFSFFQSHASFVVGYAAGVGSGAAISARNVGGDSFISRKFDYVIACDLHYEKIKGDTYEYVCPNPPQKDLVLFMSLVFNSEHWPSKIIYYMAVK